MAGVKGKKEKRVWIDSQTEEEIMRGIREAKDISEYNNLAASAYLRAKEDYLMGINFSRVLTLRYGNSVSNYLSSKYQAISVGRVMTCVLGMVVAREREIRNFVKTKYYKITGKFGEEQSFCEAEWKVNEKSIEYNSAKLYNETGFKKKEDAEEFINKIKDKVAVVTEIKKSKQKENPPLLFNLAEIQNECSKKFKIKPDETLAVIQELYEKKLVTYPRTDARVLSTEVAKEITKNLNGIAKGFKDDEVQKYINKMKEEKYSTNLVKTKYVNDSKITDHYAIIPTGQGYENYEKLNQLQKDIYKIIVKRFLAIFYSAAEFNKLNITINIENEIFTASQKVCIKQGYLEILKPNVNSDTFKKNAEVEGTLQSDQQASTLLSTLKKGQGIKILELTTKEAETSPPTRYNSGSMILAMENAGKLIEDEELREQIKGAGIGTSATRAEIIKKLEKISYIAINNKTQIITPTLKGEAIYDVVNKTMPDMLNPKLTASWEKGLDMVAKKEIPPNEFMTKLETYINSKFDKLIMR